MSVSRDDVLQWLSNCARVIAEKREYLIELDAAIGDADHGANMDRGFQAVLKKLPELADKDIGVLFKTAGMTLVSTVGGAGGPLYGTFFLQAGDDCGRQNGIEPGGLDGGAGGGDPRGDGARQSCARRQDDAGCTSASPGGAEEICQRGRRPRFGAAGFGGGRPAGDAGYHPAGGA